MTSYNAQLVGVNFRPSEAKEIVKAFVIGDTVDLEREPENPYDSNAIQVFSKQDGGYFFVGYVEKGQAAIIAPQMDEGYRFTATVNTRLSPLSVLLHIEPVAEPVAA